MFTRAQMKSEAPAWLRGIYSPSNVVQHLIHSYAWVRKTLEDLERMKYLGHITATTSGS